MSSKCTLQRRLVQSEPASFLRKALPNLSELEIQLLASRGVKAAPTPVPTWLQTPLNDLIKGAERVFEAIKKKQFIVVVADYDCDGATACVVMVAGLRAMGASIGYVVPDRLVHGYGISPSVVDLARERYPKSRILITVDNGILGHAGISHAQVLGLDVVVTDHHLQGDTLPDAYAVINPSRLDDTSGLGKLAGVGVALWLVAAVKKRMTGEGLPTPPLNFLLPYVAIGTVADMVGLDDSNRQLISAGMDRIRSGQAPVGIMALLKEAGTVAAYLTTQDIGFGIGPRINAAGRLASMDAGIELLLEQDPLRATKMARTLTDTNDERKRLQKAATEDATISVDFSITAEARSIVRGNTEWHPGIVGLVASRLKDAHNLPTFVFSLAGGYAKGSGRSIPGFHLKDAMEEIARRDPSILAKFGGHAMAAGATLTGVSALAEFARHLEDIAQVKVTNEMMSNILFSDGAMPDLDLASAARVLRHPWGQGFEAPAFDDTAKIDDVRPLGKDGLHWKIQAKIGDRTDKTTVVLFNQPEPTIGQEAHIYLQPGLNTWKDSTSVQWLGRILA